MPSTAKDIKNTAFDMQSDLQVAANKAGRRVRNVIDTASAQLSQAGESVVGEIRANPMRASLIALCAGAVFGALLRRR